MTFQFLCPEGHLLQGEEAHMGMQCQCPQCGVAFIIPTVERPQASVGAPTGAPVQTPQIDLAPLDQDDALAEPAEARAAEGLEALDVGTLDTGDLDDAAVGEALVHIPCPNGHELEVPLDMIVQRAMCPHCQVEFRLRREKSVEYIHEQEALDRKRAEFWFKLAIIAAGVVGAVLLIMFLATMIS
jgi:hypothetical protein